MGRIKAWDELTICDNFLFLKVMQNKRICKRLIEKILGIRIRKISYPVTEKNIDIRYDSKSVRLDVFVEDDNGTLYDIEMQTTDGDTPDELPKRALLPSHDGHGRAQQRRALHEPAKILCHLHLHL